MSARSPVPSGDTLEAAFARECRLRRDAAGWTQAELAARAGVTQAAVSCAERAAAPCTGGWRAAIARALGTTAGAMTAGDGGASPRDRARARAARLLAMPRGDLERLLEAVDDECGHAIDVALRRHAQGGGGAHAGAGR